MQYRFWKLDIVLTTLNSKRDLLLVEISNKNSMFESCTLAFVPRYVMFQPKTRQGTLLSPNIYLPSDVSFLLTLQIVFLDSFDSCSSVLFYCSSRKTWVLVTVKRDVKVGQFTLKIQLDVYFVYFFLPFRIIFSLEVVEKKIKVPRVATIVFFCFQG